LRNNFASKDLVLDKI